MSLNHFIHVCYILHKHFLLLFPMEIGRILLPFIIGRFYATDVKVDWCKYGTHKSRRFHCKKKEFSVKNAQL